MICSSLSSCSWRSVSGGGFVDAALSPYTTRTPLSGTRVSTGYRPVDALAEKYPPITRPSTSYTASVSPPQSHLQVNAWGPTERGAFVSRRSRMNGVSFLYAYGAQPVRIPDQFEPVWSSRFQSQLSLLSAASFNAGWYIAYPAATVMNGGKRNTALSARTPQLSTRTVGAPGVSRMQVKPQYTRVQRIPRYTVVPRTYNTTSAGG